MTDYLALLRQEIIADRLDYFLLPNQDEFMNEYLPESAKRLQLVTGFTGSNGYAIIGVKQAAFFTDGRYMIQAAQELNQAHYKIYNISDRKPHHWLHENSPKSVRIGFDPKLHSQREITNLEQSLSSLKPNLIPVKNNPIDKIWTERPSEPCSQVFIHPHKYAGISWQEKCQQVIASFSTNSDAMILSSAPSICWLLNIRGSDVEYTPLALAYLLIRSNGKLSLFIDINRLNHSVRQQLHEVEILPPNSLSQIASNLLTEGINSVSLDNNQVNYWLYLQLTKQAGIKIINLSNPCLPYQAKKNKTEIKGAIKSHITDGIALVKFLYWLQKALRDGTKLDEINVDEQLLNFRKMNPDFVYPSFATISSFGSNGAIVHYHATPATNKKLRGNSLYLLDSGGQYLSGTTDITRTILIGRATKDQIENFTRVLKGHIALARARFPAGTDGASLDALARYHLWQAGRDYDHGTGHGVGSFLSVHESPPSISKRASGIGLTEGMIVSNEPGYYEAGNYGIRIESLLLVVKSKITNRNKKKFAKEFLEFQILTMVPIDYHLIDFKMLTRPEKKWLADYHQQICHKLVPNLTKAENKWLNNINNIYQKCYRI